MTHCSGTKKMLLTPLASHWDPIKLIKLLGSNYNAVVSLAEGSALQFIHDMHTAHQRPEHQSSVRCCTYSLELSRHWICKDHKLSFSWVPAGKAAGWHGELPCLPKYLWNESNFSNWGDDIFLLALSSECIVWKCLNKQKNVLPECCKMVDFRTTY